MRKHTVLFLAADPGGTDPRTLGQEAFAIWSELKRAGYRDRFEFETCWATSPLDLLRELRAIKPTVVHFSARGGTQQNGLYFPGADGEIQLVSSSVLGEVFGAVGASVKLVVLNACYSEALAEALLGHVDSVVGMSGSIHDDAARSFAIGFYGALGECESVAAAYMQGTAAVSLEGLPDGDRPRLRVRAGVDAGRLVLAGAVQLMPAELPCPYPGMRPYSADDAAHFHGRDAEIEELLARLHVGDREIYVIGPSGCGKSSLIAAGVLPRLARGVPGLGSFVVRSMRPGEHPTARLGEVLGVLDAPQKDLADPANAIAALLAHRAPDASVLIVIDQLEELFTLAEARERATFLAALRTLRNEPRCVMLLALRADFFGAFMTSPLWADHHGRISRVEVGPLRGAALRDAIAQPARDLGVLVEPELLERLLADAGSEPGILPLLQEATVQLWDRRRDQRLALADYEAMGDHDRSGIAVALSRRADATLRAFTPTQEAIARRILLRLVSFGEGRPDTRRQLPLSRLRAADDDAANFEVVLGRLIGDRLLTTNDDDDRGDARIDLTHEAMITAWPTLAAWIRTRRADEQHRRQLEAAAAQWEERGRGARGLLDELELAEVEAWRRSDSARELGESREVAALIAASSAVHGARRRRRRGLVGSAFAMLVVFIVVVVSLATTQRRQMEAGRKAEADLRRSQQLLGVSYQERGRKYLLDGAPLKALPYLFAAREIGEDGPPLRMLFWMATRSLPAARPLEHQARVVSAAFSPDGARIVTASEDLTARIWDAATGKPLTSPLEHRARVVSAAFSPDGTRIVTASDDLTARIWDAATGKPLTSPLEHRARVVSAAFSPDSTRIVTASDDLTAQIWNATTGKPLTSPLEHRGRVRSAAFNPDGTRIVTTSDDLRARIWEAATGRPLARSLEHPGRLRSAVFSPDGTRIMTVGGKTARVWDTAIGTLTISLEHQGTVWSASFSPDSTRIVTASADHTAQLWDAATGKPVTPPLEHQETVWSATFSPDGTRVATASGDKAVQVWDAATGNPLTPPLRDEGFVTGPEVDDCEESSPCAYFRASATFSFDGMRVVTVSNDKAAHVWEISLDQGTLAEWSALAERSPFVLSNGVLSPRASRARGTGSN